MNILAIILSIFLPPVAVFMQKGIGTDFWVNLILTIFMLVPGILHALIVTDSVPANICGIPTKRVLELVMCIIAPPVAVFLAAGFGVPLLINIILCFVMYFPAIIHALIVYGFIACGGGMGSKRVTPSHA